MSDLQVAQVFPARVILNPEGRATPAQLGTLAKDRAPNPDAIDPERLVFITTEASSNRLDAYSTWMGVSTLRNFEADAAAGVSFQDGHLTDGLVRTLGQSLAARYIGPKAAARPEGVAAVEVDVFTERGLDAAIDSFIRKAEIGLVRDVSVGFYLGPDGMYRCALCNRDMFDYSDWDNYCPHLPGRKYPKFDSNGKKTDERVVATAEIVNAHLAELSAVYDGATPEASILVVKARQLADAGQLDVDAARFIEQRYRVRIPGAGPIHAVGIDLARRASGTPPAPKEGEMTLEEQLRALLAERGVAEDADPIAFVRDALDGTAGRIATAVTTREEQVRGALASIGLTCEGEDLLAAIRGHGDSLKTLRDQAKDGEDWRKSLLDDLERSGVRAQGDKFDKERALRLFGKANPADIKAQIEEYESQARKIFPGGRATTDEEQGGGKNRAPVVPLSAYRA